MEVEKAFKRLLVKSPFYGLFCLSLPKVVTRKVPTLCVSKQGISCQLNINPDFWEKFTDDEQIALLQHEVSHIALQHMFISDSFADQKLFNISADAEVNSYIDNLPKDGVTPDWLGTKIGKRVEKGLGTKKYYELIQEYLKKQEQQAQNPQMPCNGGQGDNSSSDSQNSQNPSDNSQNLNHIEQAKLQLTREPRPLPKMILNRMIVRKKTRLHQHLLKGSRRGVMMIQVLERTMLLKTKISSLINIQMSLRMSLSHLMTIVYGRNLTTSLTLSDS